MQGHGAIDEPLAAESNSQYGGLLNSMNRKRLFLTLLVVLLALTATLAVPAGASTNKTAVKKGSKFLTRSKLKVFDYGFKADAIQALTAARKFGSGTKRSAIDRFLVGDKTRPGLEGEAANYAVTAGATGKLMLAAVTAGRRSLCNFGNDEGGRVNLYALTESFYSDGRYGDTAFDQGFAMLGLAAAHRRVPKEAVKFVKNHRGKYGWGFGLSKSTGDDVQSTALLIEALRAAGAKKSDKSLREAYKWLYAQRNPDMGYNHEGSGGETNANATAMVIRAGDAVGKDTSKAKRALRALQATNGSFRMTPSAEATSRVLSTSEAVIALAGRHYPVVTRKKAEKTCT